MGPDHRTKSGDLTASALIAGGVDQWATRGPLGFVVIELRHSPEPWLDEGLIEMPWVVCIRKTERVTVEDEHREYRSVRLSAARKKFKQLVRQNHQ